MSQDKYTEFEEVCQKVSRFVAKDFPEVEVEDLFQDLMLYVLQNDKLVSNDADFVWKGLHDFAVKKSWEYRKQALTLSPQYAYRTSDVRSILENLFEPEHWSDQFVPEDMRAEEVFDDSIVQYADVRSGYDALSLHYRKVLFRKYALQQEVSSNSVRAALERLTDYINFYRGNTRYYHEGPGRRRVISNREAQYILDTQGEDDGGSVY